MGVSFGGVGSWCVFLDWTREEGCERKKGGMNFDGGFWGGCVNRPAPDPSLRSQISSRGEVM